MIRIVTDSTCEAPPELLTHPLVTVVPLYVIFGQESFRDNIEITREQFWERLPKSDKLPTTSQATPAQFDVPFRTFTDAGDSVVAITLSAKLSRTYESALLAKESLAGRPIHVVDSKSISVGQGLMVQQAVDMASAGASSAEIVARLERMRDEIRLFFTLQTLEYLQRGGRIGKAQAFMGTLLQFKPLLSIVEGEVHPAARVRSMSKAIETMEDLLAQQLSARGARVRIGVTHADSPTAASEIAATLTKRFDTPNVFTCTLGPVIGTHVGPGTVGAAVYGGD
jgi:DegV family protein with EDD domain